MEGTQLGHFTLLEKVGEGGMGRVYKARDTRLERLVAIKLLPVAKLADPDRRARFIHEARTASALNHPNIVTVYEIDQANGTDFIAMEYVEGKTLDELTGRKGLKINEALKCAVQIADALAKAHTAGIIHRDLKPGNVMVTEEGRVKVLDFGLAKLTEPAETGEDVSTRTIKPATEEGKILGTVAYMSPEQAEGKKLDARSDIFSFGAVLYEMLSGRRAFQKESKTSTLAAIIHKEPEPLGAEVPQELSRIIRRCLRKDAERRFQHMADVSVALAELKDESDSGQLTAADTTAQPPRRRSLWPAVGIACVALAAAALVWTYLNRGSGVATQGPDLVRLSPDDGYSYEVPSISSDGKFVAYVSDRGGSRQVWLQQVAGGDPIQLTHSADPVMGARFFPDGSRLLYGANSADGKRSSISVIPTLGGEPRVLASTNRLYYGMLSPDGTKGAYFESESSGASAPVRLMVRASDSGQARELSSWTNIRPERTSRPFAWTSDSRYLVCVGSAEPGVMGPDEWDWYALPVEGGSPRATGAGDALRAAGLKFAYPVVAAGDRVLFMGGKSERVNVWEVRLSPDSWRVRGAPRQLTYGTENQLPASISSSGTVAMQISKTSADLYLLPLSPTSGQPVGIPRRLTRDGRLKTRVGMGGDPGSAYFRVQDIASNSWSAYALDLESGKQTLVVPKSVSGGNERISPDGRQVAYSIPEGNSFSIRIADAGAAAGTGRLICTACGVAFGFSRDGRFLFLRPEAVVRPDPKRKYTIRLLEVASGKHRPWLEHPTDSILLSGAFGQDSGWVVIAHRSVGTQAQWRPYLVPWREEPVPLAEWIEVEIPENTDWVAGGNVFQFLQAGKLMAIRFDPQTRALSDPYEVKYLSGSDVTLGPNDSRGLRGPGLVFSRQETTSSVWLMKLPR